MNIVRTSQNRACKTCVFIGLSIVMVLVSACTLPPDYPAAVVVYSDNTGVDGLEGKVVFLRNRNMKKNRYTLSLSESTGEDTAVYQVDGHRLLMFKIVARAKKFAKTFAPFVGAFLTSSTPLILRETPGINTSHVATFDDGTSLKVISPLYVLTNNTDITTYKNQRSYWVHVQYTTEVSYTRGWVLITQNTTLNYQHANIYNSSTIAQVLSGDYIWKDKRGVELLQKGGGPSDLYNNKYGVFVSTTDDPHITTLSIKTNESTISIPSNHMWPTGKNKAIDPTYAISIAWDTKQYIYITFANDITQIFVPVNNDTMKEWKARSDNYKIRVYKYLTAMRAWTSSLFGRVMFAKHDNEYTLGMKWQISNTTADGIGLKNVRDDMLDTTVYLDYVPSGALHQYADTVLAWQIEDTEYLQIAALKTISRNKFSVQLVKIIPIPTRRDARQYTSYAISDIPKGVSMVFADENTIP